MQRKHWVIGSLMLLVAAISVGLTSLWLDQSRPASQITAEQSRPLILIPGSDGTTAAFNPMLKTLNAQTAPHPILKLTIAPNHQIHVDQQPNTQDLKRALIVVGFQNNADGNSNVIQQAQLFAIVAQYLQNHYHVKTANALGYSNGGLVLTRYLTKLAGTRPIQISHLMLFGTPFTGTDASDPDNTLLKPSIQARQQLPKQLTVTNVAGDANDKSDGIVPVSSVHAGRRIFQDQVKQYVELTLNTPTIDHPTFPSNHAAIHLVRQLLLFE